jgi:hypothetical protein
MRLLALAIFSMIFLGCDQSSDRSGQQEIAPVPEEFSEKPIFVDNELGICGKLDFTGIIWPSSMDFADRKAMALSLNVTGSYEGKDGWANITNNFDGQGLSLGLLQQNFGQGSLQPLLVKMQKNHIQVLLDIFLDPTYGQLNTMLAAWKKATGSSNFLGEEIFPDQESLSHLDIEPELGLMLTPANQASVNWAVANLFLADKKTFKPEWRKAFVTLAMTKQYRSLQIERAFAVYKTATSYFNYFKFKEIRSMLLMYDYVTQNGGFNSTHKAKFDSWYTANPLASESQKAAKLLEIRLVSVRPQYVDDVRRRKSTIMNGTGVVHSTKRNMPKEFCFDLYEQM